MRVRAAALSLFILLVFVTLAFTMGEPGTERHPADSPRPLYLDTAYSFEERAADLVSRMTPEEKQSQLGNFMPGIPRLGVNAYNVWGEALHGVASFFAPTPATSFPNSVAVGASWDPELIEREATAISEEARGLNAGSISNLTFWSPVVEPARDPRWGRTGESYGEDPFLVSKIAGAFVRGMKGTDTTYLKAVPTAKHFFANNSEFNRHTGTSNMDARDLREYYVAPYRALIEKEDLTGIMTSYNRVNGIPVTGSNYLVNSLVRRTYGMDGYVTGDCGAVGDIFSGHRYVATPAEAAAMALKAGVDTDCGNVYQKSAIKAVREGYITEADMDLALLHIFTTRMRTGEFDPPEQVAYTSISRDVVASSENAALAIEVGERTAVLLKNDLVIGTGRRALPLDEKALGKIAIIGPKADQVDLGPYSGQILPEYRVTPLEGIKNLLSGKGTEVEVVYRKGASASFRGNLFRVSSFEIVKTDGSAQKYNAADFSASSEGVELTEAIFGRRIRNLNDGDWTSYSNVDVSNVAKIGITLSIPGDGGTIELRVGSRTGELLTSFDIQGSANSFMTVTKTADANQISVSGRQKVFLIYQARPAALVDRETLSLAASADTAVIFVGTDDRTAGEEADRRTLILPGNQVDLIKAVSKVNPHTVVVMQTLGMVEVEEFKHLASVPGIIWYGFNGQGQGAAIAGILFGDVNPGGKLNATWYRSVRDLPEFTDYELRGGTDKNGRTYWYFDQHVSFEFGYGLSYTTFEFSNVRINKRAITPNDQVTVSVEVKNSGPVDGDEVVQLYVRTPDSPASLQRPIRRLKGFQRVTIPAGETKTVSITVDCSDLWFWDKVNGRITFDEGRYLFEIGASSRDIRGTAEAVMSGTYNRQLKTVVAECGQVSLDLGSSVRTTVTAAMSDDSFLDLDGVPIRYSSNRPSVASVDNEGLVTAKAPGVATITAAVTAGGKTVSGSYAVKVKPDLALESILVKGKQPEAFDPKRHGYSILLTRGSGEVPQVEATVSGSSAELETMQALSLPGTALIRVTDSITGEWDLYGVHFGFQAQSDEFNGNALGSQWRWVREDAANWSLSKTPGSLVITGQEGDIMNQANGATNILLQAANTDWFVESRLVFSRKPSVTDQQGGLVAYQDDDNYVKVVYDRAARGFLGAGEFLELVVERNGSQYVTTSLDATSLMNDDHSLVFRLEKRGSQYRAYYSRDGKSFSLIGITDVVLRDVQAGLIVCNGAPETRSIDMLSMMLGGQSGAADEVAFEVAFDDFHIRSAGLRLP